MNAAMLSAATESEGATRRSSRLRRQVPPSGGSVGGGRRQNDDVSMQTSDSSDGRLARSDSVNNYSRIAPPSSIVNGAASTAPTRRHARTSGGGAGIGGVYGSAIGRAQPTGAPATSGIAASRHGAAAAAGGRGGGSVRHQQQQPGGAPRTSAPGTTTRGEPRSASADTTSRRSNTFIVCGYEYEVDARYTMVKPIGKGAYGVVCSAHDTRTKEIVAIKKIAGAFDNSIDAKRTLREIRLLRHLRHENVIAVKDVLPPSDPSRFNDVYVAYELMDTDLHQIIRSGQPLSDDHCQYFVYQLLRGLKYVHSANILHRDLKPSNLLLNANCDLKICDFGLARTINNTAHVANNGNNNGGGDEDHMHMTEYVVTRWYRAPELLLSCKNYTTSIDMWSVGCILAELLGRKPLFPGKDYVDQLHLITSAIGSPTKEELDSFACSEKAKNYVLSLPPRARADFSQMYPSANPLAVDLIERTLVMDPSKRISVEEALAHPYFASLHDENDEPSCPTPFDFHFDRNALIAADECMSKQDMDTGDTGCDANGGGGRAHANKTKRGNKSSGDAIRLLVWEEIFVNNPEERERLRQARVGSS